MKSKDLVGRVLAKFSSQIDNLSEEDLQKVADGTHELSLTIKKKKCQAKITQKMSVHDQEKILDHLQARTSREDALAYIADVLKTKEEMAQFAKFIRVSVLKQDKVEDIKSKIVESTVGAVLRSNAIQGRNT